MRKCDKSHQLKHGLLYLIRPLIKSSFGRWIHQLSEKTIWQVQYKTYASKWMYILKINDTITHIRSL